MDTFVAQMKKKLGKDQPQKVAAPAL
jgi:hypothetical protein